ncbi:hypothetical protein CDD80_6464 [Ophiocordyceps camponoti-rufipedis]|uniref:Uncharacterized protein n=1 Tax=Ophiocordyceps camponoti-rufipedis TaxID=2004952 RepID=A0A2C5YK01_9HYPO|nr:hypothetical protein CDD80_6464 [Ophiocordyceps camponoti-rufipedis]
MGPLLGPPSLGGMDAADAAADDDAATRCRCCRRSARVWRLWCRGPLASSPLAQLKLLGLARQGSCFSVRHPGSRLLKPEPAPTRHLAHYSSHRRHVALPFFYPPTPLAQPSDPSRTFFFVQSPVLP